MYTDNEWIHEDNSTFDDWTGYLTVNVTDFALTAYANNLEYQDYVLVEYVIVFCGPSESFTFSNDLNATAANDPDEYGGIEYWIIEKQGNTYNNYIASNSTFNRNF